MSTAADAAGGADVLTINAGSSSIKFALFEADSLQCRASGQVEGIGTQPRLTLADGIGAALLDESLIDRQVVGHSQAMQQVLAVIERCLPQARVGAVGHRIVHGGAQHSDPLLLDEVRLVELERLVPLAPLHQPHNLAGVRAAAAAFPRCPQVGCFDTAFHRGRALSEDAFAIPRTWYEQGVRRYGFHGLSYEYVTRRLAAIAPAHAQGRVVLCHLGSGASMCATLGGRSVATTMGFSPLDGLPMGTRPGRLDPGVLLYLMQEHQLDAGALTDLLYRHSGLLGLSGVSNDLRALADSTDPHAREAIDYFVQAVRRELGALAAVLGGLDAVVFCGGIGENARAVRADMLRGLQWLGIELDEDYNATNRTEISADHSRVRVFVVRTDEERVIAEHTLRVVRTMLRPDERLRHAA